MPESFQEPHEESEESGGLAALVQRRRRLLEEASKHHQEDAAVDYLGKDAGICKHLNCSVLLSTIQASSPADLCFNVRKDRHSTLQLDGLL